MAKRLVISRKAYLDIDRIISFNNERNRTDTYSEKVTKNLFKKFIELSITPLIGIATDDRYSFVLIWNKFYIFYELEDDAITILSVYHQKENIDL